MKLLLDTHIWLWSLLEPSKLTRTVARELRNPANELWLSPISIWETLILFEKGRLPSEQSGVEWLRAALDETPTTEAPLTVQVVLAAASLKLPHRDPADRFLIATANVFELTLVTADETLLRSRQVAVLANR